MYRALAATSFLSGALVLVTDRHFDYAGMYSCQFHVKRTILIFISLLLLLFALESRNANKPVQHLIVFLFLF